MKLTIQITTSGLKKLTEDGGYNGLVFNVEESYESSERLRGMAGSTGHPILHYVQAGAESRCIAREAAKAA